MTDAPAPKSQLDKFEDLARELETDDGEARFDERLKKVAKTQAELSKSTKARE